MKQPSDQIFERILPAGKYAEIRLIRSGSEWHIHAFQCPPYVINRSQRNELVTRFLSEECECDQIDDHDKTMGKRCSVRVLKLAFDSWLVAKGIVGKISAKAFSAALQLHGFERKPSNGEVLYLGVRLRDAKGEVILRSKILRSERTNGTVK